MSQPKPGDTRFLFVTGGVVSSLGKGIASASIGRLLVSRGFRVQLQKLDPYINVDPGTMSPFQHGEVFVTEDGAETDLDIGHYERFIDENLSRNANHTSGSRPTWTWATTSASQTRTPPAPPTSPPAASTTRSSGASAAATTSAPPSR